MFSVVIFLIGEYPWPVSYSLSTLFLTKHQDRIRSSIEFQAIIDARFLVSNNMDNNTNKYDGNVHP